MLLATADFASLPGAVTPDFTLPDGFLFTPDGIVNYIGANSLTYGCLPTDGVLSLHCDANNGIMCTATSVAVNSPTNYAGASGSIVLGGGEILCDSIDNDCDPGTEDDPDNDNDGVGVCTDCDDGNSAVFPGNVETTCNGIDDDCDPGTLDDPNADGDAFSLCNGDCDDGNAAVFPGNAETLCNSIDDDCDPGTEDDPDNDNDGVGVCTDCDDGNSAVFPGNVETTCNGIDDDCDPGTLDDPNADGDAFSLCNGDCDDGNPAVFPGNVETTCNGVDDDCDPNTLDDPDNDCVNPLPADPPNDRLKNRYISFKPNNGGQLVKLKVTLTASLPHPSKVGDFWWVQAPLVSVPTQFPKPLVGPGECVALLGPENTAAEIDWDDAGCLTLHVTGCPIEPTSGYEVRTVVGGNESTALTVPTALQPGSGRFWGDTVGFFDGVEWTAAQGVSNITDALVAINTWQGGQVVAPVPGSTIAHLSIADVEPGNINTVVNFADVLILIRAFQGNMYPFGPADADGNCP